MTVTANSFIAPQTPNSGANAVILSTALTSTKAFDGTEAVGTSMALAYTAGANGGRPTQMIVNYSGTAGAAPSTTSTATVLRLWKNNGSVNTTAANNAYIGDFAVAAQLYTNTAQLPVLTFQLPKIDLQGTERIYVGNTTAVGGTNCALSVLISGADY